MDVLWQKEKFVEAVFYGNACKLLAVSRAKTNPLLPLYPLFHFSRYCWIQFIEIIMISFWRTCLRAIVKVRPMSNGCLVWSHKHSFIHDRTLFFASDPQGSLSSVLVCTIHMSVMIIFPCILVCTIHVSVTIIFPCMLSNMRRTFVFFALAMCIAQLSGRCCSYTCIIFLFQYIIPIWLVSASCVVYLQAGVLALVIRSAHCFLLILMSMRAQHIDVWFCWLVFIYLPLSISVANFTCKLTFLMCYLGGFVFFV